MLLGNHGVVAGGRDLAEAVVASQFVEKAAMILIHAQAIGGVRPIAEERVAQKSVIATSTSTASPRTWRA